MLFNSTTFGAFLIIVFSLYWFVLKNNTRFQNILLLISSYIFYGWWDYRFLGLLLFSSLMDYFISLRIADAPSFAKRKAYLVASLIINLGLLGFFKYYNFFVDSAVDAAASLGIVLHTTTMQVILPVGISFYTFQSLSYTIDIYRNKYQPTRNLLSLLTFVSFFPQLVAGPIERASHMLQQFENPRIFTFENGKEGAKLILWGLFKKIVIADQCAIFVNQIFGNPGGYSASELMLGAVFFSIQIYGDFSGYSDIAVGTARLFGFDLMRNFRYPFFSRDIAEFWRRWHISLSSWFRDYVYIPLGGSKGSVATKIRNVMIIFLLSGFWHGANWTFIIWGGLHGLYYVPLALRKTHRAHLDDPAQGKSLPGIREFFSIAFTFLLVTFAFIFFRAANVGMAFEYIGSIFSSSILMLPRTPLLIMLCAVVLFLSVEWANRENNHPLNIDDKPFAFRYATYGVMTYLIIGFSTSQNSFIYFQF